MGAGNFVKVLIYGFVTVVAILNACVHFGITADWIALTAWGVAMVVGYLINGTRADFMLWIIIAGSGYSIFAL